MEGLQAGSTECPYYLPGVDRIFCEQLLRTTSEQADNARTLLFRDSSQPGQYVISFYQNGQFEHNLMTLAQFQNWPAVLQYYGFPAANPYFCAVVGAIKRLSITQVSLSENPYDDPIRFLEGILSINLHQSPATTHPDLQPIEQAMLAEFIKRSKSVRTLCLNGSENSGKFLPLLLQAFKGLETLECIHIGDVSFAKHVESILRKNPSLQRVVFTARLPDAITQNYLEALSEHNSLVSLEAVYLQWIGGSSPRIHALISHIRSKNPRLRLPHLSLNASILQCLQEETVTSIRFISLAAGGNVRYGDELPSDTGIAFAAGRLTVWLGLRDSSGQLTELDDRGSSHDKITQIRMFYDAIRACPTLTEFILERDLEASCLPKEELISQSLTGKASIKRISFASPHHSTLATVLATIPALEVLEFPWFDINDGAMTMHLRALASNTQLTTLRKVAPLLKTLGADARESYSILRARNPNLTTDMPASSAMFDMNTMRTAVTTKPADRFCALPMVQSEPAAISATTAQPAAMQGSSASPPSVGQPGMVQIPVPGQPQSPPSSWGMAAPSSSGIWPAPATSASHIVQLQQQPQQPVIKVHTASFLNTIEKAIYSFDITSVVIMSVLNGGDSFTVAPKGGVDVKKGRLIICFGARVGYNQGQPVFTDLSEEEQQRLGELIRADLPAVECLKIIMNPRASFSVAPSLVVAFEGKPKLKKIVFKDPKRAVAMATLLRNVPNLETFSAPGATPEMLHEYLSALDSNQALRTLLSVTKNRKEVYLPTTESVIASLKSRNRKFAEPVPPVFQQIVRAFNTRPITAIHFVCVSEETDSAPADAPIGGVHLKKRTGYLTVMLGLQTNQVGSGTITSVDEPDQLQLAEMIRNCHTLESFSLGVGVGATVSLIEPFIIDALANKPRLKSIFCATDIYVVELCRVLRTLTSLETLDLSFRVTPESMTQYLKALAENSNLRTLKGIRPAPYQPDEITKQYLEIVKARNPALSAAMPKTIMGPSWAQSNAQAQGGMGIGLGGVGLPKFSAAVSALRMSSPAARPQSAPVPMQSVQQQQQTPQAASPPQAVAPAPLPRSRSGAMSFSRAELPKPQQKQQN